MLIDQIEINLWKKSQDICVKTYIYKKKLNVKQMANIIDECDWYLISVSMLL
jgi:hypothetical protein